MEHDIPLLLLVPAEKAKNGSSRGANCFHQREKEGKERRGNKQWKEEGKRARGCKRKKDSGHEGERQIKFDRKLHEIVGEPRWSAPVRQPMPTRLFLATDYHRSPARRNEGALCSTPRPDPTTSHVPDARNAPNVQADTLFGSARRRVVFPFKRSKVEWDAARRRIIQNGSRRRRTRQQRSFVLPTKEEDASIVVIFPTNFSTRDFFQHLWLRMLQNEWNCNSNIRSFLKNIRRMKPSVYDD